MKGKWRVKKLTGKYIYNMDYEHNQTIVYLRKEKAIPNILVYYTFQKKDSVMLEVLYEWDVYNFDVLTIAFLLMSMIVISLILSKS